jgi:hypothetical protein
VREEDELKRLLHRVLAGALVAAFAMASAAPCVADERTPTRGASLTKLSSANLQVLKNSAVASARQAQEPSGPATPGSFFRSRKGAVALTLVAAGIGFTVWSIHHDRKPVRSPVR